MALQPVDFTLAVAAALRQRQRGRWHPADAHRDLKLPWSTVNRAVSRLREAGILREDHVVLSALAELMGVLRYLAPLHVDREHVQMGTPTSFAAPVFAGRIRYTLPYIWSNSPGQVEGHPVAPLHPCVVEAAAQDPALGSAFALVDALREGRSREMHIAMEELRPLLGLPMPFGAPT